jgi:predicted RNA-binding protein with PUA-like domain
MASACWLFKSEPDVFSFEDLVAKKTTSWEGVRNFQARNFLRDQIQLGDRVLFYHSSCDVPAVMGTATVSRTGYPDPTQFDRRSEYYDPKSTEDAPRWFMVDITVDRALARPVTLEEMRGAAGLEDMKLLRRGMRLSIQPVTRAEWDVVLSLGSRKAGNSQAERAASRRRAKSGGPALPDRDPVKR